MLWGGRLQWVPVASMMDTGTPVCAQGREGSLGACVGEEQKPQLPWLQSEPSGFNTPELAESPWQSWG